MSDGYRVAVVGATGAVGGTVLEILAQRASLPIGEIVAFASERSAGTDVPFGDQRLTCRALADDSIGDFDLVFSAAGGAISREWAPRFADAGALVIDKTSYWRTDPDVPLVVPEVNPDVVDSIPKGILSSPNCSTMQLVVALNPIRQAVGIEEIVLSTYQSVSGSGRVAIDELETQAAAVLAGGPVTADVFPHQVAFNAMPQVETFQDETNPDYVGYSTEELKIMRESRRIFGLDPDDDAALPIHPTCVRLGIAVGHSQSIRVRTTGPMSPDECREELRAAPGVTVVDDPQAAEYPMAIDAAGIDDVLVGRVRRVPGLDRALSLWAVGDNLRKGAALNAVQIAELLHSRGRIPTRAAAWGGTAYQPEDSPTPATTEVVQSTTAVGLTTWRARPSCLGDRPSASPTSCGRCNTGMFSGRPTTFSASGCWRSRFRWHSGHGVTRQSASASIASPR